MELLYLQSRGKVKIGMRNSEGMVEMIYKNNK